ISAQMLLRHGDVVAPITLVEDGSSRQTKKPMMKIAVIGLGYVGLPLSLQFARSGVKVLGLDIDPAKIESCNAGQTYIQHIESASIGEEVKAGRFSASTDFSRLKEIDAVIICVP